MLKGINYLKNRDDPVALKEEEYPEWLWRCLDKKVVTEGEGADTAGDEFCGFFFSSLVLLLHLRQLQLQFCLKNLSLLTPNYLSPPFLFIY